MSKWNSPGMDAFAQYIKVNGDEKLAADKIKKTAAIAEVYGKIANVKDDTMYGKKALALAQFAASSDLYKASVAPADKKKWGEIELAALAICFESGESAESRLNAAQVADEIGDKAALYENLLAAAQNNANYNQQGAEINTKTMLLFSKVQAEKSMTPEQEAVIKKSLDLWATEKTTFEKDQAEIAKEKAAADAAAKVESDKIKAEEQKAIDDAKAKAAPAPGNPAPGTAGPAPSSPAPTPIPAPVVPGIGGGK